MVKQNFGKLTTDKAKYNSSLSTFSCFKFNEALYTEFHENYLCYKLSSLNALKYIYIT